MTSDQWPFGHHNARLHAVLRDERGAVVAESVKRGGNFTLDRTLSPGRYTLEVRGRQHGGADNPSSFSLRTSMQ